MFLWLIGLGWHLLYLSTTNRSINQRLRWVLNCSWVKLRDWFDISANAWYNILLIFADARCNFLLLFINSRYDILLFFYNSSSTRHFYLFLLFVFLWYC